MNRKGFTLTEILVVLIIAGILMALILPNALQAITKADETAHEANVKNINAVIMVCYAVNRNTSGWTACASLDELVNNGFLKDHPSHPVCDYDVAGDEANGYYATSAGGSYCGEAATTDPTTDPTEK